MIFCRHIHINENKKRILKLILFKKKEENSLLKQ